MSLAPPFFKNEIPGSTNRFFSKYEKFFWKYEHFSLTRLLRCDISPFYLAYIVFVLLFGNSRTMYMDSELEKSTGSYVL